MNVILRIIIITLQIVIGQLLGFVPAYMLGVGDGWELVVIALGYVVGVWGVGTVAEILRRQFSIDQVVASLLGTFIGSFLGVLLILITPAFGFAQLLMPLTGAVLGYYIASTLYASGRVS
ncbi:MAG: hypothetical protein GY759_23665 [Chloroflexi bacterium]|nr:hypothetical protein [Chloroflexota bacterium]